MKRRGMGAVLLALPLTAVGVFTGSHVRAAANSAPAYWEGSEGAGAILLGGRCPVEVERERLTLELKEFPSADYSDDEEAFFRYGGRFTAEYSFYNPTEQDLDLTLVFPLGALPSYAPYDVASKQKEAGYTVEQDGKKVDCTLRHTYNGAYSGSGDFELETGLERLDPPAREFYADDLPVTVYTYEVETESRGEYDRVNFALSFGEGFSVRSRIFCSELCNYTVKGGKGKLTHSFDAQSPIRFQMYVLGDDVQDVQTLVYRFGRDRDGVEIDNDARVELTGKETTDFSSFALSFRAEGSEISDRDWKNALIDLIEDRRSPRDVFSGVTPKMFAETDNVYVYMRWFEYRLHIAAGERTRNTVSAPLYPAMDSYAGQNRYRYEYLLSPAQTWAKFGELVIDVETPFFISGSSLDFVKRDGGYVFTRQGLPMGELTFTLTEQEVDATDWEYVDPNGNEALTAAIVILSLVVLGAVVTVAVLTVQSKKRRRRREEEENKLLQARAQEGKIDLPEDQNKE